MSADERPSLNNLVIAAHAHVAESEASLRAAHLALGEVSALGEPDDLASANDLAEAVLRLRAHRSLGEHAEAITAAVNEIQKAML